MIIIVMMMTTTTMTKMTMKSCKKKQLCYISNVVKTSVSSAYSTCLQSSSSECIQSNLIVVINMLPSIKNNKRLVINILRPILKI